PRDIVRLVVGESVAVAFAGLAAGAVATVLLARLLGSLLFGVGPLDPTTLAVAALALPASALLASWLPARRAARESPMAALRPEQAPTRRAGRARTRRSTSRGARSCPRRSRAPWPRAKGDRSRSPPTARRRRRSGCHRGRSGSRRGWRRAWP